MSWITLNDTTVPVSEIISIEMKMEMDEPIYIVYFKTLKPMRVHLNSTGGKWLYMACDSGTKEALRAGLRYESL
jgi:hypothetical protein